MDAEETGFTPAAVGHRVSLLLSSPSRRAGAKLHRAVMR
jgi:hypothetical protein